MFQLRKIWTIFSTDSSYYKFLLMNQVQYRLKRINAAWNLIQCSIWFSMTLLTHTKFYIVEWFMIFFFLEIRYDTDKDVIVGNTEGILKVDERAIQVLWYCDCLFAFADIIAHTLFISVLCIPVNINIIFILIDTLIYSCCIIGHSIK